VLLVPGRFILDRLAEDQFKFEVAARLAAGDFRHDRNPGLEVQQRRSHVNPGRMAEEFALHPLAPRRMLVDQHGDVTAFRRGAQNGADSLVLVDQLVELPGAVVENQLADQRIFKRPHEGAHRAVRRFRKGGAGNFPVPVVGGDDDVLPPSFVAVDRDDTQKVVLRRHHVDFILGIELVHLDHLDEELGEFEVALQCERLRLLRVGEQPGVHHMLDRPDPMAPVGPEQQPEQQPAERIPGLQRKRVKNPVKNAEEKVFRVNPEFAFRFFLFCHLYRAGY